MTKNEATELLVQFTRWVQDLEDNDPAMDLETKEEVVAEFLRRHDAVAWPTIS